MNNLPDQQVTDQFGTRQIKFKSRSFLLCTPAVKGETFCGDGVRTGNESCDGADLGGETCAGLGFDSGTLACDGTCSFDPTGCTASPSCGDGVVNTAGEQCDGSDLDGNTCDTFGHPFGSLSCDASCDLDTSGCTQVDCSLVRCALPLCQAGEVQVIPPGECCPVCVPGPICGDDAVNAPGEQCDGPDLDGYSCPSLNYPFGTLTCDGSCAFDASRCTPQDCSAVLCPLPTCEPGEILETPPHACCPECVDGPATCGDDVVNAAGEQCDGADLGGATCASYGYPAGNLSCTGSCTHDVHLCTEQDCGTILCLNPVCATDESKVTLQGECCPRCVPDSAAPTCGDGVINLSGEQCDGSDFNATTCASFGYPFGDLNCDGSCLIDVDACTQQDCSLVICLNPVCQPGEIKVTLPHECCPVCVPN